MTPRKIPFAFLPLVVAGCVTPRRELSDEDRAILQEAKQQRRAREDLRARPGDFVVATNVRTSNSGFLNDYCRLSSITLANNASVDVRDPRGTATYLGVDGRPLATVPWQVSGEIPSGEQREFVVGAQEISGRCTGARVVVDGVGVPSR